MQIHTNTHEYTSIQTYIYKQIQVNTFKYTQIHKIHANTYNHILIHTNTNKAMQMVNTVVRGAFLFLTPNGISMPYSQHLLSDIIWVFELLPKVNAAQLHICPAQLTRESASIRRQPLSRFFTILAPAIANFSFMSVAFLGFVRTSAGCLAPAILRI